MQSSRVSIGTYRLSIGLLFELVRRVTLIVRKFIFIDHRSKTGWLWPGIDHRPISVRNVALIRPAERDNHRKGTTYAASNVLSHKTGSVNRFCVYEWSHTDCGVDCDSMTLCVFRWSQLCHIRRLGADKRFIADNNYIIVPVMCVSKVVAAAAQSQT